MVGGEDSLDKTWPQSVFIAIFPKRNPTESERFQVFPGRGQRANSIGPPSGAKDNIHPVKGISSTGNRSVVMTSNSATVLTNFITA